MHWSIMSPIFCHWWKWGARDSYDGRVKVCMGVGRLASEAHNITRMQGPSRPIRRASAPEIHSRAQVWTCVALLILLTFAVDINFRLVAFGGFYAIPILISLWLKSFRTTLVLTALCCALTFGEALFIASRGAAVVEHEPFTLQHLIANHAVEVASLVVVCLIGFWRLR